MWLLLASFGLMCLFFALTKTVPRPGHYLRLWIPLITAAIAAIAAGFTALMATFSKGERSLLMLLPILAGVMVILWCLGELAEGLSH